jgi:hypothetical protein
MTSGENDPSSASPYSLLPDYDPTFGVTTTELIEPPLFALNPPETDSEQYNGISTETDYRNETNPTS